MSSFDLDTIRHAISSRMQQGRLALSNPSAIVAALATTALFSLLPEGTLSQPLLDSILINIVGGGLGVSALYDFLKGFIDNLQSEEENQYSADEIRQRFEQALRERLEESGQDGRTLRADVSRLLQHVEGINVALSAAPSDLRQPLVDSLIELGSNFEEFRWILIEQSQLLVEIQKRSQDIMSDVQRLVRQVARLEQNQQALPAKLKLLLLLQSERPHPGPLPRGEGESPYKGLPAFQKEDADYFFGREEQVADLVHQLAQDKRFLAVIGPSGSGKSSLVRAGLLSQLESNTAHQLLHSRDWRTVIFKPGSNPIAALANSVGSLSINIGSRALLRGLQDSPDELARAIRQQLLHNQPLHVRLLLIVDQFEELFTRCRDESERLRFIESLLHVSQTTACRTIVLLTMRADFYGHCASHPRLRSQIQDHHLLVGPLHESELRRVIELPANKAGLQLEPGLTETIIKDVADAPGALPLLSQALLETWKRRQDTTLTRSGYEASGGVQQAIAQTADKVYNEQLTSEQQTIARQIFLRLVELGESEQYDSRRRTSRSELGDGASEVLLKLADARLIVTDQESVEVAHEALIREWPTLRHWLDDDREGLRIHRHLTEAAQEWQQLGRDIGDLYRGARLAQAREWAEQHPNDLNALEQEFLQASQQAVEEARQRELERERALREAQEQRAEEAEKREEEQKRANTQWRRLAAVLAVVFLVAVGIAFYANTKAEEALEAEATAEVARDEADQNAEEARDAQATAEVARNDADQKAKEAREAQATAEEAARKESEARIEAEQQTRIATARELASQSQAALEDYPQRSLLLAVEALQATMPENEPRVREAEQALRDALANAGGIGLSEGRLSAIAISPDNNWLVTGSRSGTARLWDLTVNDPVANPIVLTGHEDSITEVAMSPDNHWLVTGSGSKARLWDLTANDPAASPIVLTGHEDNINEIAISPDNHWLVTVTSGFDNTARLWDLTANDPAASPIVLTGHEDFIWAIAISPDNHWLVTASGDRTARLWDLTVNDPAASPIVLTGHESSINAVTISPNNHWLVTGSSDGTARLWDLTANDPAASPIVLTGHGHWIAIAISPDNHWLVTGSSDGTVRLWDLTVNDPAASPIVLTGHENRINDIAISPNNHWLVTGSSDGTARLWDLTANDPASSPIVLTGHEGSLLTLSISQDSHWLVTSSKDKTARLWDLTANDPAASPIVLTGHEHWLHTVAVSPNNHWLVTASNDDTARLWDLTANDPAASPRVLTGHENWINAVAISLNNNWLVTSSDKTARLWDLTANDPAASPIVLTGHEDFIKAIAISPNNHWLVTGSWDHTVRLWDLTANDLTASSILLTGHESHIQAVAISSDNRWLVTGSADGTARLWDLTANNPSVSSIVLTGHEGWINAIAISPDNHWLVTGGNNPTPLWLWDLTANDLTASSILLTGHKDAVNIVAISNHWLVTSSGDRTALLWDLTANDPSASFIVLTRNEGWINAVAISPDNHWLVTGNDNGTAHLWDLTANDPSASPLVLTGDEDSIQAVAISPDNHWLVTGNDNGTARLWDLTANDPAASPLVLTGDEDSIKAIAISNHWLVTGSSDGTVRLWNLRLDELSQLACRTASRNLTQKEWRQYLGRQEYRKTCAELPVHYTVLNAFKEEGAILAKEGYIDGAIAKFRQALALEPTSELDPEVEARRLVAEVIVEGGEELAKEGDVEGAIAQYQKALELDPTLEIDPETEAHRLTGSQLITKGRQLAEQGEIEEAMAAYSEAQTIFESVSLRVAAWPWNILCRYGSLWGYASDVMYACTEAVELASEEEIGPHRDSRGLARALTGDYAGAIEDFRFFVEWSKENGQYEEDGRQREAWIAELEAGRNPFDAETLEALRNE